MNRLRNFVLSASLLIPVLAAAQAPTPMPSVPAVPPVPPMPTAPSVRAAAPAKPAPAPKPVPAPRPFFDDEAFHLNLNTEIQLRVDDEMRQAHVFELQSKDLTRQVADQARELAAQARVMSELDRKGADGFTFTTTSQDSSAAAGYRGGLDALQQRQYDKAIVSFDRVIAQKADRADAALYWKAFAQFKLVRTDDALAAIAQLRREYPQSHYLNDAKVLEADARKAAGQPVNPANATDDEIKLLAIQGIQKSEQAVPLLEGVLNATNSLAVKKRAIYVLALSDDPKAHPVLLRYAKGGGNPDLQNEAVRYLASRRDSPTLAAELRDIYTGTQDTSVKLSVIDAYRTSGDKAALLRISGEKTATIEVRRSAITRLGGLADAQDIMALYQQETDPALRVQLVSVLAPLATSDQLVTIVKTDKDPAVRLRAVRLIGSQRNEKASQALVALYGTDQDKEMRRAVISALMSQNNADTLVALAKKESDLELKRELVRRLSDMAPNSKAAADYLMEQLK